MQTLPGQAVGISGICQRKWAEWGHENMSLFHSLVIFVKKGRKLHDIQSRPREKDKLFYIFFFN